MHEAFPNLRVSGHPLIQHKMRLLSDADTDARTFRELVSEITSLLIYEATSDLPVRRVTYRTPMEVTEGLEIDARVALVPILRAGLGMTPAALEALPRSVVRHLGLFRDEQTHEPVSYYNKLPSRCTEDVVMVLDPMLATGGSATAAVETLKKWGAPRIVFVGLIAAPEGVEAMLEAHPDVPVHIARLDRQLNGDAYICPGLGDAGDRMFGTL
ncbi:MAG: uracil phosphoribosyltransferase [Chloroflexota bacterium]